MNVRRLFGYGVTTPFRRVGSDLDAAEGIDLVRSAVGVLLGTRPGEIPWRPSFGLDLNRLRHRLLAENLRDAALLELNEALGSWDPRVRVVQVETTTDDTTLRLTAQWAARRHGLQAVSVSNFTVDV